MNSFLETVLTIKGVSSDVNGTTRINILSWCLSCSLEVVKVGETALHSQQIHLKFNSATNNGTVVTIKARPIRAQHCAPN